MGLSSVLPTSHSDRKLPKCLSSGLRVGTNSEESRVLFFLYAWAVGSHIQVCASVFCAHESYDNTSREA